MYTMSQFLQMQGTLKQSVYFGMRTLSKPSPLKEIALEPVWYGSEALTGRLFVPSALPVGCRMNPTAPFPACRARSRLPCTEGWAGQYDSSLLWRGPGAECYVEEDMAPGIW